MAAADDETDTTTAPAPVTTPDMLGQALQLAQQYGLAPQLPQRDTTPVNRSTISLLGEALAGGPPVPGMTPAEQEAAGRHALMSFGTSLMGASGVHPGVGLSARLAQGFQGAQAGETGYEQMSLAQLGAQQAWAQQQAQNKVEAIKAALPFLRLQAAQGIPNPLAGNAPAGPNTSISAAANGTYESTINNHEGAGKDPNSSAVGGFLSGTWNDFAAANPDLFKGMSPAQILAARSNSALRDQATSWLAKQNAGTLSGAGVTPSGQSLGIAHYIGATPAAKVMAAPDNAPVSGFVSDAAVKANPELATMTVGQLKRRYAGVPDPGFLKPAPAQTATATPPAASTAPSGVQMGGPPPPPPGGSGAPSGGGGIGVALNPPLPTPPVPPVAMKGSPLPAGKLQTTGKAPGVADIIQSGMKLAQGGLPAGTVMAAGPAAGTPPAASAAWGPATTTTIGNYNAPGAAPAATTTPPVVPAPQPATQAQQPPAPPPVTTPTPGGRMSFEDWQKLHPGLMSLTDEERAATTVQPPNLDDLRRAQQTAAQQLDLARRGMGGDPNKSLSDYNTATTALTTAQQKASTDSATLVAAALKNKADQAQTLYNSEQQRIQDAEQKDKDRKAAADLETQRGQQAITQAGVTSDIQAGQKALEAVNATREGANDTINTLEMAKNLAKQAGTSGFLQQWPQVANALVRNNLLTPDEVQQLGAQRSLDAVMNKVILSMRAGSGMSRMTNFDLQFLQNAAPSSFTPEQMRPAMFAAIQTAAARQVQYADRVNELHAGGMPVWQAKQQADTDLGHLVKETPTTYPQGDPRAGQPMSTDDQNKWIIRNVTPGTFYTQPNGALAIRGEGKQGQ